MKVVLDTNVFISAVFFGGVPGQILEFWKCGQVELVTSEELLSEYVDVLHRLAGRYRGVDTAPIIGLVIKNALFVEPAALAGPVCDDPGDDKFIATAMGGHARVIVSGDSHLIHVSGHKGIEVLRPAAFIARMSDNG